MKKPYFLSVLTYFRMESSPGLRTIGLVSLQQDMALLRIEPLWRFLTVLFFVKREGFDCHRNCGIFSLLFPVMQLIADVFVVDRRSATSSLAKLPQ